MRQARHLLLTELNANGEERAMAIIRAFLVDSGTPHAVLEGLAQAFLTAAYSGCWESAGKESRRPAAADEKEPRPVTVLVRCRRAS